MKAKGIRDLLICIAGLMLLAVTACSPPGSSQDDQGSGSGGGGTGSQQQVETGTTGESANAAMCDVKPPDINLKNAKVGFSQSEEETNPFRIAETQSIKDEAKKRGVQLATTNAQSQASKQLSDIQDLLSQGVDILIVAPLQAQGLEPALNAANKQGVPVFLIDRETAGTPCKNFITFMGSNFLRQGEQAGQKMSEITDGQAQIAELSGTPGASVTNDRAEGFKNFVEQQSGMEIIASQTGNFVRTEGQQVMEQLIQSNPDTNAVYAHNDEMAIGAIQALKSAGKNPGEDVKVVSIDGTKDAAQAIIDGDLNATVTTNPRFGPLAFSTIEKFLNGDPIQQKIIVQDKIIDQSNAKEYLNSGAY